MYVRRNISTGMKGLDNLFQGLVEGDNLVWQVDSLEEYKPFVKAFAADALDRGRRVVYFRFATHAPFLPPQAGLDIRDLSPSVGFEPFVSEIHRTIVEGNRDCIYIFDCLSELAADWCSDRMLGNFFMLICPYVFDYGGGAYFTLIRNRHSFHATDPVRQTTQILIDVHQRGDKTYVHPLKVQHRHSKTMYMLHRRNGDDFEPVTQSSEAAEVFSDVTWNHLDGSNWRLGFWSMNFAKAEEIARENSEEKLKSAGTMELTQLLRRMLISRKGPVLDLAERYLSLADLLAIRRRMIGTGMIGGKSVGLVLAQAILRRHDRKWSSILEPPDSFFIGADVFYTYLVQNGLWWLKQRQKDSRAYLDGVTLARNQILNGKFPEYLMRQFRDLLEYFGQVPIIVRSSSLLEDDFDSSFAGKAESILCVNQGSLKQRVEDFVMAIRRVYASNMSESALRYRASRGLLDKDEQMAILIQRISGTTCGRRVFPHLAGVGLPFNPYVWDKRIDPNAGVMRVVMGMGTRAVIPHPEDHTRIVALNIPELQLVDPDNQNAFTSQQEVDVLDLDSGRVVPVPFCDLAEEPSLPLSLLAERDLAMEEKAREHALRNRKYWTLSFTRLFSSTSFVPEMRELLQALASAYGTSVDVEFTATFSDDGHFRINLLQCRPFLAEGVGASNVKVEDIDISECVVRSTGPVLGCSRSLDIDRIIYVSPSEYANLPVQDRYAMASLVGELIRNERLLKRRVMLIGPGRWGTKDPSLGVPTSYSDLNGASILCEIAIMHEGLIPDLSLGSHFFNELVEMRMLYFALYPKRKGNIIDTEFFEKQAGVPEILSKFPRLLDAIKIVDATGKCRLRLSADAPSQLAALHRTAG
ncbi:MAG TPA: pyruvate, phosphate dikinase [Lentisphaeria bacterium]|nr:MAG: hypothetical protein A2X48_02105 [Lentisphaerae bacterium GWF2_49_21]HBC88497.1 pyruvate, phosphate dikinase [Lentisphaeria bacterium]